MDVLIIDSTEKEFGKHAYSQLAEFDFEVERIKSDIVDTPRKLKRKPAKNFLVIVDSTEKFAEVLVEKLMDLEIQEDYRIQKVLLQHENESDEVFERRGRRLSGAAAENLAEYIKQE